MVQGSSSATPDEEPEGLDEETKQVFVISVKDTSYTPTWMLVGFFRPTASTL